MLVLATMDQKKLRKQSKTALLLVDVVNHFEFPDGKVRLRKRTHAAGVPVIFVNDNFGQWHSNAAKVVDYCLREGCTGRRFVEVIQPGPEDYCVLKPMHSAFYQTPLDVLLRHLGVSSLLVAGMATNSCILCTAHDANMRELELTVVADCCAARSTKEHQQALANIREMASARVVNLASIRL
jgi:nicotinamidase-related amidase